MKYICALLFLSLGACTSVRQDPYFDISANVKQHSVDPKKGIHLVIYPVDREGEK